MDYRFQALHEIRGEDITEGQGNLLDSPIEFYRNDLKTNYVFGSAGAKGRFEFGLGYSDKTYQNYRNGLPGKPNAKLSTTTSAPQTLTLSFTLERLLKPIG